MTTTRAARPTSRFAGAACFGEWDLATGLVSWSPPLESLLGEPVSERPVPLDWWRDRIHPEDRDAAVSAAESAIRAGSDRFHCVYRVRVADGRLRDVSERGFVVRAGERPVRVVSAIFPAEAGPASEGARDLFSWLEQSLARFRTFVDGLPLLAWAMTPEGWIYFYNQRWYEYTGTTPEQMEGWGWVSVHDPYDLPRMLRLFRRALATGEFWEDEFRLRRADGAMRWHLSRAMPLKDAEGRVIHWFGTNTEVDDQKLALEERSRLLEREQAARREAEAASRAKDEFLALVSHELRTPLGAIVGWTHVLEDEELTPQVRKAVDAIGRSAQQQAVLIDDLLDVARILSGKLQIQLLPTRLCEPILEAVEAVRPAAEARAIAIDVRDASKGAVVVGDPIRLRQVATNLVENAVKFSPQGARVEVRIWRSDANVVLEVEDRGEGIEADGLDRIFERFHQGDRSRTRKHGGLGLGLSIVSNLVDLHGGTVRAESAGRGQGALFRVELPLGEGKVPVSAAPVDGEEGEGKISLRGVEVLVVDDDGEAREVLSALLLSCGASVSSASSVAEALESLRSSLPDVVLSDVAMPVVDGFGLVARVRDLRDPKAASLPIVALTAFASLSDREAALAGGFDAYLTKPIDPARLTRTIARLAN